MKKLEGLPSVKSVYHALEGAAVDAYGFAVACHGGAAWLAEPDLLDTLLLGLENAWFTEDPSGRLSHQEFREEFFQCLWDKCRTASPGHQRVRIGTDVPLGHEEMAFYQLSQLARAAVFLRTKKKMSYATIALVLRIQESSARTEVEKAREQLLGRRLRAPYVAEDDF